MTLRRLCGCPLLVVASLVSAAPHRPPDLGPNVIVFDPSMPTSQIQATVDAIATQQVPSQFGDGRVALLFKPGTYGSAAEPLIIQVGYYTEVAGLGASPGDVVIVGHVDVYNQCDAGGCFALVNFWRSVSNLTIQVTGLSDCRSSANFWAVSQAAPMRRVDVVGGNLSLMDYCTAGPQFASGGFIADSRTGFVINGSQQQFLVRDSVIGGWSNAVWNQVFAGTVGAPAQSFPDPPYTTLATNPISRERPYLFLDASGGWRVFVPDVRTDSSGRPKWWSTVTSGPSPSTASFTSESTALESHWATSSGPRSPVASTAKRRPSITRTPDATGSTASRAHARSRNERPATTSTSTRSSASNISTVRSATSGAPGTAYRTSPALAAASARASMMSA